MIRNRFDTIICNQLKKHHVFRVYVRNLLFHGTNTATATLPLFEELLIDLSLIIIVSFSRFHFVCLWETTAELIIYLVTGTNCHKEVPQRLTIRGDIIRRYIKEVCTMPKASRPGTSVFGLFFLSRVTKIRTLFLFAKNLILVTPQRTYTLVVGWKMNTKSKKSGSRVYSERKGWGRTKLGETCSVRLKLGQ